MQGHGVQSFHTFVVKVQVCLINVFAQKYQIQVHEFQL